MVKIGDIYSEKVVFAQDAVNQYGKLMGDYNSIHTNLEIAKGEGFPSTLVQGLLVGIEFERVFFILYGNTSLNVTRDFIFIRPVFVGIEYAMSFKLIEIDSDGIGTIKCWLKDTDGKVYIKCVAKLKNKERFIN